MDFKDFTVPLVFGKLEGVWIIFSINKYQVVTVVINIEKNQGFAFIFILINIRLC